MSANTAHIFQLAKDIHATQANASRRQARLNRLDLLTSLIESAQQERELLISAARTDTVEGPASWRELGEYIGLTKQAAQQRYGKATR